MKKSKAIRSLVLLGLMAGMSSALSVQSQMTAQNSVKSIIKGGKSYTDFVTKDQVLEAGNDLTEEIAEEGIILMKNENNALPYAGVKKISVFGKGSAGNFYYGGSGSGGSAGVGQKTIYDSLTDAGFSYNPVLRSFYEDDTRSGTGAVGGSIFGGSGSTVGETPIDNYDRSISESTEVFSDAAIVMISRGGGEGYDLERYNSVDFRGDEKKEDYVQHHYLELSKNEADMLEYVKKRFDKITIVLNSAEAFELGSLVDDEKIGSIVWISTPGNTGVMALGKVLNGTVNPSGRTVDTYARDFTKDPTWENFGDNSQTNDGVSNMVAIGSDGNPIKGFSKYGLFGSFYDATKLYNVQYEEGIYVGYRYYETAGSVKGEEWYKNNVVFPFGYGLSYTTFSQEIVGQEPATDGTELDKNGDIKVTVKVTNTGDVAGKEVVQLYYTAPYSTDAPIEKSYVNLAVYDKTKLLRPGESENLTLTIHVQDMASYDYSDINKNNHKGYELEAGNYEIKLMKNAHEKLDSVSYKVSNTINYDTDRVTGNKVENLYDEDSGYSSLPHSDDMKQTIMSRGNFDGTFPKHPDAKNDTEDRCKSTSTLSDRLNHIFSLDDVKEGDPRYVADSAMTGKTQVKESTADADRTHTYMFKDVVDWDYDDDEKWDTLLNELKFSEMQSLVTTGLYHIGGIDSIGKPMATESDGPSCISEVKYCSETMIAATFNDDLAEQMGQLLGNEALFAGKAGWYAPALNIHRSPFGGRNFEYFSEDPILSGKMAAAEIRGVQKKGVYAFPKHFAINEQETEREGLVVFADEQTLREVYFKAFQIAVQEGQPLALMTSFSVLGDCDCASNWAMLNGMLRGEWGFKGKVTTDGYTGTGSSAYQNMNRMYMAGGDYPLGDEAVSGMYGSWDDDKMNVVYTDADKKVKTSSSYWQSIRDCVKHILYADAHSLATNNLLDTSVFTGKKFTAAKDIAFSGSVAADASKVGTSNIRYEVTSGSLPAGMSMADDGTISGTATSFGTSTFTVTMYGDNWVTASETFSIEVVSAFKYEGSAMDSATVGTPFEGKISSDVLVATTNPGDKKEYGPDYGLAEGSVLPNGLELEEDGTISGVPLVAGTYHFTVTCTTYTYSLNFYTTPWSYVPTPVVNTVDYTITVAPTPCTVTYNANYTGGTSSTATVASGAKATKPADLARAGYIFKGWFKDAACTTPVDFNDAINGDVTYYAGWAEEAKATDTSALEKKISELEEEVKVLKDDVAKKEDKTTKTSGCGGSVIAATSGVAALALVGAALILKKKREEK